MLFSNEGKALIKNFARFDMRCNVRLQGRRVVCEMSLGDLWLPG